MAVTAKNRGEWRVESGKSIRSTINDPLSDFNGARLAEDEPKESVKPEQHTDGAGRPKVAAINEIPPDTLETETAYPEAGGEGASYS